TTALYKEFFSPQGISLNRVHTIEVKNLEHEIFKRNGVSPISYTFESGKTYAVTGANGIGKTSFLKMISGEIR
ncbi:ATP-binding cassette domain-containing protein, partial [Vibrio parahaemolyticus]